LLVWPKPRDMPLGRDLAGEDVTTVRPTTHVAARRFKPRARM
jgi:hypothetical protein